MLMNLEPAGYRICVWLSRVSVLMNLEPDDQGTGSVLYLV